jgi:hypothetical protein
MNDGKTVEISNEIVPTHFGSNGQRLLLALLLPFVVDPLGKRRAVWHRMPTIHCHLKPQVKWSNRNP